MSIAQQSPTLNDSSMQKFCIHGLDLENCEYIQRMVPKMCMEMHGGDVT